MIYFAGFQISFYSLDMKKGNNICYPLSTITIPKTYSEASYLKILIKNFWYLRGCSFEFYNCKFITKLIVHFLCRMPYKK